MNQALIAILIPLALVPLPARALAQQPGEDAKALELLQAATEAQQRATQESSRSREIAQRDLEKELREVSQNALKAASQGGYERAQEELASTQRSLAELVARLARSSKEDSASWPLLRLALERESQAHALAQVGEHGAGPTGTRSLEDRVWALEQHLGIEGGDRHGSLEERVAELERVTRERAGRRERTPDLPQWAFPWLRKPQQPDELWMGGRRVQSVPLAPDAREPRDPSETPGATAPPAGPLPPLGHIGPPDSPAPRARDPRGPFRTPGPMAPPPIDRPGMAPERRREIEDLMRRMRGEMERLREEMNRLREEIGRQGGESAR
jgi:hypothetical protein